MDVSLVSPTEKTVFAPRQVAEYVDTNASDGIRSRLLPNEVGDLRRADMKIPLNECATSRGRRCWGCGGDRYLIEARDPKIWERACSRKRPDNQPLSTCHPTIQKCGSGLAREGALTTNHCLPVTPRSKNVGAGLPAKPLLQPITI